MNEPLEFSEWLKKRLGRFTASEMYKLFQGSRSKDRMFGDGAMTYIRQKAAEILTMTVPPEMDFKQTNWGGEHEWKANKIFSEQFGAPCTYYGKENPVFFEFGDYCGCSPDWESQGGLFGADFKCPWNSSEHLLNLHLKDSEDLKKHRWEYYCQLQTGINIRGWDIAFFVSYDSRMVEDRLKMKVIEVTPDDEWADEFAKRLPAAIEELKKLIDI